MTVLPDTRIEDRLDLLGIDSPILRRRRIAPGVVAARIVTAPSGVWVLAARQQVGRPTPAGGLLGRRTETLRLGARAADRLVASVGRQVTVVRSVLDADVPVGGMLCVLEPQWPLFGGSFTVGDVRVLWPRKAREVIGAGYRLDPRRVLAVHEHLAATFPAAPERHPVRAR